MGDDNRTMQIQVHEGARLVSLTLKLLKLVSYIMWSGALDSSGALVFFNHIL